jgi:hypothetical protein
MKNLKLLPVLVALAILPDVSFAADDVATLRAELQALKNDYSTRVDALETRIQQLESSGQAGGGGAAPPPAPPPPHTAAA